MTTTCIGKYSRSHLAERLLHLDGAPFSLKDYPFFYAIYNTDAQETLLKTARQISKTLMGSSACLMASGVTKPISEISVGDRVISLDSSGTSLVSSPVTWKSPRYQKSCLRISTRLGFTLGAGSEHPIYCWDRWVRAQDLRVGDRVATVRRGGEFTGETDIDDDLVTLSALMLRDGCCGVSQNFNFTKAAGLVQDEFLRICHRYNWRVRPHDHNNTTSFCFSLQKHTAPRTFLEEWGMWGKPAKDKKVPPFVWGLDRRQTALFLNRLWSTDGSVGQRLDQVSATYSSMSVELIDAIRQLLWKFGIPSKRWSWMAAVQGGTREAFGLRIETQGGLETFLSEIGALGKSEGVQILKTSENNNRDTLPPECNDLIRYISDSAADKSRRGRSAKGTLHSCSLRRSPMYPLTYIKLARYVEHFRKNPAYDQGAVEHLAQHLECRDIYWDRITSIEKIGEQWCYDISVANTESFVAEGLVTHNSTYCANLMIIDSIRIPHFKTLYLTPTREQTSKFSNTRLTKTIHYSPHIRKNYIDTSLPNNVLLQVLKNGSLMVLTYAMDDPDRVRGNTSDRNLCDEVQDIHYEAVIPVVKECAAVSKYAYMAYCGTPKSMENTIEHLWQRSSKSEWIMKCDGCGAHQFIDSARSICKHGVICIKCGRRLNVREGFWYDFAKNMRIKGFHVSQPMLPVNNEHQERWDRILDKLESYSESKFKNEVLGVSDAIGTRFISQDELLAMCHDYYIPESPPISQDLLDDCRFISGGVDWSGGGSEYLSRTVAWVFGYTNDSRYRTLYFKIFPSDNPIANVEEVAKIFNQCRCDIVVGDAGEGAVANSHLMRALGAHRMFQVQYGSFFKLLKWNKKDRYLVDRTAAIDSFMLVLKHQGAIYPNAAQMAIPMQDILNEYEESTMTGQGGVSRKVWRHAPSAPDDCLHAQVFAWLAMKVARQDLELYDAN